MVGSKAGMQEIRRARREIGRKGTIHRNEFMSLLIFTLHPIYILKFDVDSFH